MANEIIIKNNEGILTVSSVQVAKYFEKSHNHIISNIENFTDKNWAVKNFFIESYYVIAKQLDKRQKGNE